MLQLVLLIGRQIRMSVNFLQSTKEFSSFCPYIVKTNEGESL